MAPAARARLSEFRAIATPAAVPTTMISNAAQAGLCKAANTEPTPIKAGASHVCARPRA